MLHDLRDTPAGAGPDAPARAGPMLRFARAARTRWRGHVPGHRRGAHYPGVVLGSGAVLISGVLLLLVTLPHGIMG
jgi:hypothetical protein